MTKSPYLHVRRDIRDEANDGSMSLFWVDEYVDPKTNPFRATFPLEWVYYNFQALKGLKLYCFNSKEKKLEDYDDEDIENKLGIIELALEIATGLWQRKCWFLQLKALRKSYVTPQLPHIELPGALIITARPMNQGAHTRLRAYDDGRAAYMEIALNSELDWIQTNTKESLPKLVFSLEAHFVHEVGHCMGLAHSPDLKSPMSNIPAFGQPLKLPTEQDVENLRRLYLER